MRLQENARVEASDDAREEAGRTQDPLGNLESLVQRFDLIIRRRHWCCEVILNRIECNNHDENSESFDAENHRNADEATRARTGTTVDIVALGARWPTSVN